MLTGQYYYYLKKLHQIKFPLHADAVSKLEILGLSFLSAEAFAEIEPDFIPNELKNLFISSYKNFLVENQMNLVSQYWGYLTSPKTSEGKLSFLPAQTEFQNYVKQWGQDGFEFDRLDDIISFGQYSTREDDLALIYGLEFLKKFTLVEQDKKDLPSLAKAVMGSDSTLYSTKPQILVVTSDELAPLFINIGCEAIPALSNREKLASDINSILADQSSIQVVLVQGEDNQELVGYLRKNIDDSILVSGFSLPTSSAKPKKTFFDQIAMSTLGVRLD